MRPDGIGPEAGMNAGAAASLVVANTGAAARPHAMSEAPARRRMPKRTMCMMLPWALGRADTPRRRSLPLPWRGIVMKRSDWDDDVMTQTSQSLSSVSIYPLQGKVTRTSDGRASPIVASPERDEMR
jgi:hypothetical protein